MAIHNDSVKTNGLANSHLCFENITGENKMGLQSEW